MPKLRDLVLPCLSALALGAVFGVYHVHAVLIAVTGCVIALLLLIRALRGQYPLTTTLIFMMFFFSLGIFRGASFAQQFDCTILCKDVGKRVLVTGIVAKEPELREDKQRLVLRVDGMENRGTVLLTLPRYPQYDYGAHIQVSGKLRMPEDFTTDTGAQFHYVDFLRARGSTLLLDGMRAQLVGENEGNMMMRALLRFKQKIREVTERLPTPESGLLMGMIFGGKNGLPDAVQHDFLLAGLIHIVVLSGENLTIIALLATVFVRKFFGFVSGIVVSSVIVVAYALIGGMEPATLRALILVLIVFCAILLRRESSLPRVLTIGALLLITFNPLLLFDDPSFQLSMLAILGLVFLGPPLERFMLLRGVPLSLTSYLAPILGAQLGVLPFIAWTSQAIAVYALPANILVLFLIEFLSISGIFLVGIGILLPVLFPIVVLPVQLALSFVLFIAHTVAQLPGAYLLLPIPGWLTGALYTVLFVWLAWRWRSNDLTPLARFTLREEAKQLAKRKIPWFPLVEEKTGIRLDVQNFIFAGSMPPSSAREAEVVIDWGEGH